MCGSVFDALKSMAFRAISNACASPVILGIGRCGVVLRIAQGITSYEYNGVIFVDISSMSFFNVNVGCDNAQICEYRYRRVVVPRGACCIMSHFLRRCYV